MKNKSNTHTEDELGQEVIDGLDLAMEICPLLDDYFCGTFTNNAKGVLMSMDNGQIFQLTVTEIA